VTEKLVEFETTGINQSIGIARLVRTQRLNSLLLDTINQLESQIQLWLADDQIKCIILDSSDPRAFCAGADITVLRRSIIDSKEQPNSYAQDFFTNEYRLDHALHTAQKPIVVWGHGIVMGGGLGLMGGCSHRIGTPATKLAMPEITIGLFPDAGGTALLSSMPEPLGLFAGLTGCQLGAGDALHIGLLDHMVEPESKDDIFKSIKKTDWTDDTEDNANLLFDQLIPFEYDGDLPEPMLLATHAIEKLIPSSADAREFFNQFDSALEQQNNNKWLATSLENYKNGSPLTARIFFEQMLRATGMTLEEMFQMELTIALQCIQQPDFVEGVRALLIDKDNNPKWSFDRATEIPDDVVAQHFEPCDIKPHPLKDLQANRD